MAAATLAFVGTGRASLDQAIADGKLTVTPGNLPGLADVLNVYGP